MADVSQEQDTLATKFEQSLATLKPRFFDNWVLPGFLVYYAIRSKAPMGRWTRRMLFTAGVYAFYYRYEQYKQFVESLTVSQPETTEVV